VFGSSGRSSQEHRIRLVTPMFGGGVTPGEPDPSDPIRGTSIRGQLQFWWRATRGAACQTIEELIETHAAVWGSTGKASPVEIELRDIRAAEPRPCARYVPSEQGKYRLDWQSPFRDPDPPREGALPYVLFPFQGEPPSRKSAPEPEKPPASFIESASFTLRVRFPGDVEDDVKTAVWAWVNFGGLGARTRRGCGGLLCEGLAPNRFEDLADWFRAGAGTGLALDRKWPTLSPHFLTHHEAAEPILIWNRLIGLWRYFRQGAGFARNPGQQANRPGRSRYPEPETIRETVHADRQESRHRRQDHMPAGAFPRAELGLPIVFHFQGRGEPKLTILYPRVNGAHADRMASPLILKPLALADGRAVPLIMRLQTPRLTDVELRSKDERTGVEEAVHKWGADAVRDKRFVAYPDSPLNGLTEEGSTLEAFLALARTTEYNFREVSR
jgi:CRISPR-associated protein Cmr1